MFAKILAVIAILLVAYMKDFKDLKRSMPKHECISYAAVCLLGTGLLIVYLFGEHLPSPMSWFDHVNQGWLTS